MIDENKINNKLNVKRNIRILLIALILILIDNSIELARRGMVVVTIDPYRQGDSSTTINEKTATEEGYGIVPLAKYIADTDVFNYVDKSKIGAEKW